jgi:hypothetical protein
MVAVELDGEYEVCQFREAEPLFDEPAEAAAPPYAAGRVLDVVGEPAERTAAILGDLREAVRYTHTLVSLMITRSQAGIRRQDHQRCVVVSEKRLRRQAKVDPVLRVPGMNLVPLFDKWSIFIGDVIR